MLALGAGRESGMNLIDIFRVRLEMLLLQAQIGLEPDKYPVGKYKKRACLNNIRWISSFSGMKKLDNKTTSLLLKVA